jgi:HNH endonuclease
MVEYPARAYGYDGKIHLDRPTPSEWRAFRLAEARKLGTHTFAQWKELRDGIGKCVACGRKDLPLAKDHIYPIARGGCDCIHNLQPLCHPCNSAKCARIIQ